ncbi:hypothetical protein J6590_037887 [Homalodisca vitripennis]|nr:hypothetical protein J6590_037887 [Homalodisca vitripennis]
MFSLTFVPTNRRSPKPVTLTPIVSCMATLVTTLTPVIPSICITPSVSKQDALGHEGACTFTMISEGYDDGMEISSRALQPVPFCGRRAVTGYLWLCDGDMIRELITITPVSRDQWSETAYKTVSLSTCSGLLIPDHSYTCC